MVPIRCMSGARFSGVCGVGLSGPRSGNIKRFFALVSSEHWVTTDADDLEVQAIVSLAGKGSRAS